MTQARFAAVLAVAVGSKNANRCHCHRQDLAGGDPLSPWDARFRHSPERTGNYHAEAPCFISHGGYEAQTVNERLAALGAAR